MGGVVLVPEGQYDFEWLSLWQRVAQSSPISGSRFDLRPTTILPTADAAVGDSFRELARFRPDAVPVLDGDDPADKYVADLTTGKPAPSRIIRYGQKAAVECLSAWVLEPLLCAPGAVLSTILDAREPTLRNLQDALIENKKDREFREKVIWECIDTDGCCERACELFHDLAAIACGSSPLNAGWTIGNKVNGTVVHVASHIKRA